MFAGTYVFTRSFVLKDTKNDLIFSCSQMVTSHPCSHESFKPYSEASQIKQDLSDERGLKLAPLHTGEIHLNSSLYKGKNEAHLIKLIAIIILCISKMPSSSGTQGLIINVSLILFLSIKDPVEQKKESINKS